MRDDVLRGLLLVIVGVAVLAGCGSDGPEATTGPGPVAGSVVPEVVRTDRYRISPNPVTGDETPEDCQQGTYLRYRALPGGPVRAILLMIPGGNGGANNFDYMARELVRMSGGQVEVWAFERRPNLLEDLTGMEAAEAAGDVDLAVGYYYEGRELGGRSFEGFLGQEEVPFLSEWGLVNVMEDIQAAVARIPADRRRTNLFVGAHSLGVVQALYYLGWDFDGTAATLDDAGYNQTAGAILLDAPVIHREPIPRADYVAQVRGVRDGSSDRFAGFFPPLTPEVLAYAELVGMAAHPDFDRPDRPDDGPEAISRLLRIPLGEDVRAFLRNSFAENVLDAGLDLPPAYADFTLTNEALLGMLFDDNFQPMYPVHMSLGYLSPPEATRPRDFPYVPLFVWPGFVPTDPSVTYRWLDYDEVEGVAQTSPEEEVTEVARLAEALYRGPTNFLEWYFATRPLVDSSAVGMLVDVPEDGWQAAEFGLNLFHTSRIDVPVLAVGGGGGMVPDPSLFAPIRDALADPARNGAPRSDEAAFRTYMAPGHGHFDVLLADNAAPGGNGVFEEILSFMMRHAQGDVSVP